MKPLLALVVFCVAMLQANAAIAAAGSTEPVTYRPGEILAVLRGSEDLRLGADNLLRLGHAGDAARLLERHGLSRYERVGGLLSPGLSVVKLVSDRPDFDPVHAAEELRSSGTVRAAIPNYLLRLFITIPNDPYALPEQWYVHSPADGDVDLPDAWDIERGDTSIVIGIADTGIDLGHPDLAQQIWTNPDEIPGNSVDDDGNGYVDDVHGWDFGNDDNDPNPHPVFDPVVEIDVGFHGTFVAGIASAATNNGIGIAGAGWRSRLMPLKVVNQAGEITTEALAEAFLYAAAEHADVLNVSLGQVAEPGLPEFFQQLVDHADSADVVCVSAAGNDADSAPVYPAANDKVIAVAATDQNNLRTSFSNWGPWVDIAAPGTQMWSSICRNYPLDEISDIYYVFLFGWDGVNPYMYGDGTSFACPLVAGTVALARSRWPGLSAHSLEQHLVTTGDAIVYDLPIGKKLNAYRAVTMSLAVGDGPESGALVSLAPARPNPFRDRVALEYSLARAGEASLVILDVQGRVVRTLFRGSTSAGTHRVEWDGRSSDGARAESGVYFARFLSGPESAVRRIAYIR